MKCKARTNKNTRCTRNAKTDSYCGVHQKIIDNGGIIVDFLIDVPDIIVDNLEHNVEHNAVPHVEHNAEPNAENNAEPNVEHNVEHNAEPNVEQKILSDNIIQKVVNKECKICYAEIEDKDVVNCGKAEHLACADCIKSYIKTSISEKKQLVCMFDSIDRCGKVYSKELLKKIFVDNLDNPNNQHNSEDKELYSRYIEYEQIDNATKIASAIDNYHLCPFCSKWGIVVENIYPGRHPQNIINVTCGNCSTIFCILCRKSYHGNDSCNKIYFPNETIISNTIDRVIDEAIIHSCPKCYTKYSKEDGCNLMSCPSCKSYSCYLCNMVILPKNGQKYWHFSSEPGKCRLYNHLENPTDQETRKSNIEYNNGRIVCALKRLILENMDDNKVKFMLLDCIKKRGYKLF